MALFSGQMDEVERLHPGVTALLRKYVLSLFIVPGVVLSLGAFALGFLLNDWARGQAFAQAYGEAFKSSFDSISVATATITESSVTIEKAMDDANKALDSAILAKASAETASREANDLTTKLREAATGNSYEEIAKSVVLSLTSDPTFINKIEQEKSEITISGQCFKPTVLQRCYREAPGDYDHFTWFTDESECTKNGYRVEGRVAVLAACG